MGNIELEEWEIMTEVEASQSDSTKRILNSEHRRKLKREFSKQIFSQEGQIWRSPNFDITQWHLAQNCSTA